MQKGRMDLPYCIMRKEEARKQKNCWIIFKAKD